MNPHVARFFQGDRVIWAIVLFLAAFSVFAVYSSSGVLAYRERGGMTEFYLIKQGVFILGGLAITWVFSQAHYSHFARFARIALLITIPLLVFTLFFGVDTNDARRWISIPLIGLTFQPSDLAKVALMLYLARQLTVLQDTKMDFQALAKPVFLPLAIVCVLIMPANLSTAALIMIIAMIFLVIGRMDLKLVFTMLGIGAGLLLLMFVIDLVAPGATRINVWANRVTDFLSNPDGEFQVQQAKIAIAQGGLFGEGPGNSIQRNILPSAFADFIYAIFIEEYGFIGGVFLLFLYILFFFRAVRLATLCDKPFGSFLVLGMALLIVFQALANMAVAVNLGPVTGVTLPFMSMGGTSLLFFSMAAGMILSVSRYVERKQAEEAAQNQEVPCAS